MYNEISMMASGVNKIISGGQTGADIAALDSAIKRGIPHGGWIPKGRKTEAGALPKKYKLKETLSPEYRQRTKKNVKNSDATLILTDRSLSGGTKLTYDLAKKLNKPVWVCFLGKNESVKKVIKWLDDNDIEVLNIAGPRASHSPRIYKKAANFLSRLFPGQNNACPFP